jgi:cytochrome P450
MPRTRGPYPPEFRRRAVELVLAGRSVRDVAESLAAAVSRCITGSSATSSIGESAMMASFPVSVMCEVLGVSRSGYHGWEKRAQSNRALSDAG